MSFFHDLVLFGVHYGLNVEIEKDFLLVDAPHDTTIDSLQPNVVLKQLPAKASNNSVMGRQVKWKAHASLQILRKSFIIHDPEISAQNTAPMSTRESNVDKYNLATK